MYIPKSIEQQKAERAIQRAKERKAMLKQIPIGVQRAIDRIAYWDRAEEIGLTAPGGYGSKQDDQDGTRHFYFRKSATKTQLKIVTKLEYEAKIKYSEWHLVDGVLAQCPLETGGNDAIAPVAN